VENDGGPAILRDYRLTNNTDILNGFKTSLAAIQNRFVWASVGGHGSGPINITSPGHGTSPSGGAGGSGGAASGTLSSTLVVPVTVMAFVATEIMSLWTA
jgi:hypothetical protein